MKVTHTLKETNTSAPPEYWSEEWIQEAIKELDLRNMTPMEREYAARQIVKAVMYNTSMKEREEAMRERDEAVQKIDELTKQRTASIINLLVIGMAPEQISDALDMPLSEVLKIKNEHEGS